MIMTACVDSTHQYLYKFGTSLHLQGRTRDETSMGAYLGHCGNNYYPVCMCKGVRQLVAFICRHQHRQISSSRHLYVLSTCIYQPEMGFCALQIVKLNHTFSVQYIILTISKWKSNIAGNPQGFKKLIQKFSTPVHVYIHRW